MSDRLSQALQQALQDLQSGRAGRCIEQCDALLAGNPGLVQALYLRGCAAYETGDYDRSASDLGVVWNNHPGHLEAAFYLGRSLRAAGNCEAALAPLEAALAEPGLELQARYELAVCLTRLRRRPGAVEQYRAILDRQPGHAQAAANLASLLERENDLAGSGQWAERALELDPGNETAHMVRATLDRRSGNLAEAVRRLQDLLGSIENPVNRSIAWNQLGQCLEGQGDWELAFDAFRESNAVLRAYHPQARPDPKAPHGLETLARIREWLSTRPMADWRKAPSAGSEGIAFLIGFPRSGTTLLDRMLSNHPAIEVLEEKSLFASLHQDWCAPGVLEALADIDEEEIGQGREIYRSEMDRHRRLPDRPLVIDKLPLNLAYLFLVNRLFPDAPVIFLQRHPLDACTSCYCQAFELRASMGYFLDLGDTARYYDAVMNVASPSLEQIANPVHALRYEDLVSDPRRELQSLLEFLALDMDEAVLDERRRGDTAASETPSYQQVSQPIHARSVGRWRHYAGRLEPVLPILRPWIEYFGYSAGHPPTR